MGVLSVSEESTNWTMSRKAAIKRIILPFGYAPAAAEKASPWI